MQFGEMSRKVWFRFFLTAYHCAPHINARERREDQNLLHGTRGWPKKNARMHNEQKAKR